MRIDRPDSAYEPDDAHEARSARSAPDDPDPADKDGAPADSDDGLSHSPSASSDKASRTEYFAAHRARVDAVYRQYAIDRSDAFAETLERETATLAANGADIEDPEHYLIGLADRLKDKWQPDESARKLPRPTAHTHPVTQDGAACASDQQPATAAGGDGSIGNDGGIPPAGDTSPNTEGEDPEGVNGGLGELESVKAKDRAADLLAERIGGEASMRFTNGPPNEFDALSAEYVAQAKPANFTLNQAFRNQAKATFEVALQSDRTPYFQFNGPPGPGVLQALNRYADRYGIEPVIDLNPLGEANA